jgi:lysine 2,3-aminomutase
MKQENLPKNNILKLSIDGLLHQFGEDLPILFSTASQCEDISQFVEKLRTITRQYLQHDNSQIIQQAAGELETLLDYEGTSIMELSKNKRIHIDTIYNLWLFLNDELPDHQPTDIFIDLYFLFMQLAGKYIPPKDMQVENQMKRWKSGLNPEILESRKKNKARIIDKLITKIELRISPNTKYRFEENRTYEQKRLQVEQWWENYKFHLAMAIKSPKELNLYLGKTLPEETMELLANARKKEMPFFITPYYLSLLNIEKDGYDDRTIRSYVLYSENLVDSYGHIRAWEREDQVEDGKPNAAGWLLPEGHNIHRRYPDVAIMIPDSMGRACGGLCAVCQRMYDFQSERLNFNFAELKPKESWDKKLQRIMSYFENDTQLRDILITGGDAFMSQNATLAKILDAVYKMALRKRKSNILRKDGEKYAELQRVRLGTRLLAYLPMRVNDELIQILKDFKEKASAAGVQQFIIQTHFESPLEMTAEAKRAIRAILSAGWTITNQLVFTAAASRRGHTAKLRKVLNREGVLCYYTFSVKGFKENYELFAPSCRSIQESLEEKCLGHLSKEQTEELLSDIQQTEDIRKVLNRFWEKYHLPFVATDKNVLNLPGIGKSMTFKTVGITSSGRRILKFEYDRTRKHSPVIDKIEDVYIVENKSIAAYLRQLKEMGEKIEEYASLWSYRMAETEPRFGLYEYPDFDFKVTDKFVNIGEIANGSNGLY